MAPCDGPARGYRRHRNDGMEHWGGTMHSVGFLDKDIRLRRPQASSDAVPLGVVARCAMHSIPRDAGNATCSGPMRAYRESPAVCPMDAEVCVACDQLVLSGRWAALSITGMLPLPRNPGVHPIRDAAVDAIVDRFRRGIRGVPASAGRSPDVRKAQGPKCGRLAGRCAAINYDCPMHLSMRLA